MKRLRLLFVAATALSLFISACSTPNDLAAPDLEPQFGTSGEDSGTAVFVSERTNAVYVIGGSSQRIDPTNTDSDAFFRRYNPNGSLAWKKTFNAAPYEALPDLAEDAQGNTLVALSKSSGEGSATSEVFKYTPAGQELWRRTLTGVHTIYGIDITPSGGFYLIGYDNDFRSLIRKYDRNGTLLWNKYPTASFFSPSASDAAGNLYVVSAAKDIYKFDPAGKLLWIRTFPKGNADKAYVRRLVIDQDALLLVGTKEWVLKDTDYEYESESDVMVVKLGVDGTFRWQRSFGSEVDDVGIGVDVDTDHNIQVAAYVAGAIAPQGSAFVLRKYTPAGQLLKQTVSAKNLDQFNDYISSMATYRTDEVYLTGQTSHDLGAGYNGSFDAFLMRLDSSGKPIWVR